jgi:hypothetical protein
MLNSIAILAGILVLALLVYAATKPDTFRVHTDSESTLVTWAMYGPQNDKIKVMSTFFNMDKMIGKDLATGLANLKALAERQKVFSN